MDVRPRWPPSPSPAWAWRRAAGSWQWPWRQVALNWAFWSWGAPQSPLLPFSSPSPTPHWTSFPSSTRAAGAPKPGWVGSPASPPGAREGAGEGEAGGHAILQWEPGGEAERGSSPAHYSLEHPSAYTRIQASTQARPQLPSPPQPWGWAGSLLTLGSHPGGSQRPSLWGKV